MATDREHSEERIFSASNCSCLDLYHENKKESSPACRKQTGRTTLARNLQALDSPTYSRSSEICNLQAQERGVRFIIAVVVYSFLFVHSVSFSSVQFNLFVRFLTSRVEVVSLLIALLGSLLLLSLTLLFSFDSLLSLSLSLWCRLVAGTAAVSYAY